MQSCRREDLAVEVLQASEEEAASAKLADEKSSLTSYLVQLAATQPHLIQQLLTRCLLSPTGQSWTGHLQTDDHELITHFNPLPVYSKLVQSIYVPHGVIARGFILGGRACQSVWSHGVATIHDY